MLGLGLFAMLAMGAFGVLNATAETGGHFGATKYPATVIGEESTIGENKHQLDFVPAGGNQIGCDEESYHGVLNEASEDVKITPKWNKCYTTPSPETKFDVHENGCWFTFTVGTKPAEADNTVHLECEGENTIEITHPNCTIHVPPQTPDGGVVYTTKTDEEGNHTITMDVTAENITTHYEKGLCVLLGTNHVSSMLGSVTVRAEKEGEAIGITATKTP